MKYILLIMIFSCPYISMSQRKSPLNQDKVLLASSNEFILDDLGEEELAREETTIVCIIGTGTFTKVTTATYRYFVEDEFAIDNSLVNLVATDKELVIMPSVVGKFSIKENYIKYVTAINGCFNTTSTEIDGEYEVGEFDVTILEMNSQISTETPLLIYQEGSELNLENFYELTDEEGRKKVKYFVKGEEKSEKLDPTTLVSGENDLLIDGQFDNESKQISYNLNIINPELTQEVINICDLEVSALDLREFFTFSNIEGLEYEFSGPGVNGDQILLTSENLEIGNNEVVIKISGFFNGGEKILRLNINNDVQEVFAGIDQQVCVGDILTLTGEQPAGGVWSSEYLIIEDNNQINTSSIQPGTYTVDYNFTDRNCSNSATKTIIVNPKPTIEAGEDLNWCGSGQVTLQGFSPTGGKWSSNSNQIIINENLAIIGEVDFEGNLSKDFILTYQYSNELGCENTDTRVLKLYDDPVIPELTYTNICGTGQTTITIENFNSAFRYDWYENNQKLVGVNGSNYTTGILQENKQFQVIAFNPLLPECQSMGKIDVQLTPPPSLPYSDDQVICEAQIVVLSANHPSAVTHFNWYDMNGNLLNEESGLGDTYETKTVITQDASYFVSAVINGCESEKKEVKIYKNNLPENPLVVANEVCGAGEVKIQVISDNGDDFRWYTTDSGGDIIYTGKEYNIYLTQTTDFYVAAVNNRDITGLGSFSCESERVKVTAKILEIPSAPKGIEYSTCGLEYVELEAIGGLGDNYYWYNINGTKVAEGNVFKLGQVSKNETYYYSTYSIDGCESDKSEIKITYNEPPSLPSVKDLEKCGEGEIEISPVGKENAVFRFYTESDRDNYIYEGVSYSPFISGYTRFFISQVIDGCEGLQQSIEITFNSLPSPPIVENYSYCGISTISLLANGGQTGSTYNWYESLEAEIPFYSGSKLTENDVSTSRNYFVSTVSSQGCESERVKVIVNINEVPEAPETIEGYICSGSGKTTLTVVSNPNYTYEWYASSMQLLFVGTIYQTPLLNNTTTYQVKAISPEGCESEFATVSAVVIDDEPIDIGGNISLCKWGANYNLNQDVNLKGGVFSGAGVFNDSLFTPDVLDEGSYEIQYTYYKGDCKAYGSRLITINEGIGEHNIDLGNEVIIICENGFPVDLNEYSPYENGTWTGEGIINNILDPTQLNTGTYSLSYSVEINGCIYEDQKQIEISTSNAETPRISKSNIEACQGELIEVYATVNGNNTTYHWYNEDTKELLGDGLELEFIAKQNFILSCRGVDYKGCESAPILSIVEIYDFPDSIISSKSQVNTGEYVEFDLFDPNEESNRYNWSFGDGQESSLKSPAIFYYTEGKYEVSLIISNSSNDCIDTLSKSIIVGASTIADTIITSLINSPQNNQAIVSPNPFKNELRVETEEKNIDIKIYDLLGRQHLKSYFFRREGNVIFINTSTLSTGVYIIRVNSWNLKMMKL
ncbi:PKD domain-containing protein [Chondrinema litorale]|uniref:Ig-like domain-containing protein n=1 Tax=Chondrinema litorale TaxID=2994555 RepID=UPI0025432F21|nr:PKD domain-containing protein [Chondrinema litorale]UZR99000.1 PKD domain-containing protein [Chondrinema litorale]